VAAGVCRLIYDANAHSYDELADFSQFIEVVQRKTAPVVKAFNQIAELNTMLLGLTDTDQTTLKLQYSYLRIQPMMDVHGSQLHKLGMLQAGMDTLSIRYQRRVFGTFVGGTLSENWTRMVKQWAIGIWPKANVMAFFTIYVPLSAVLFELYTKELPPDGLGRAISKFLFIALMLGVMIVRTKVRQWRWQDMFQDYRAMAEALRVQLYWAISRLPNGVSDSDLRKQSVEMDWIQFALRGPAVWSSAYALGGQEQHRAIVLESWIRDQCAYFMGRNGFPGRAKQYEDLNERNEKFSGFFFWLAIVLTIPTWLLQVGAELDRLHGCFLLLHRYMDHHLYGLLDMAAIVSIAFGASIAVARNIRGYEAHAKGCALMGSIYSRAECLLRDPKISDTGFKILIRELGREALSESADWLRDQRNRSVDFN
jgi:hypothetical protein